jgi:serine/threonine-protein kinase
MAEAILRAPPSPSPHALSDTEGVAFFQSRLASFFRGGFRLGVVQLALNAVIVAFAGAHGPSNHLFGVYDTVYSWAVPSLATIVCFVLWRVLRGRARTSRTLGAIDASGTIVVCLLLTIAHVNVPPWLRPDMFVIGLVALVLAARPVMVPSTAQRTFAIGAVTCGAITVGAFVYYARFRAAESTIAPGQYAAWSALLGSAWVLVTTLVSHTLYGLREKVRVATRLGQYTLTEKIGEGGMGVVYKAQHAMLRRPTAVKLLPADKAGAHDIERFEREVQLTSALTHPNTIQIYDYGRTPEGTFYYAMEYLDGITLEALVAEDGPQPPARVIAVLAQICGSLAEAHAVGLIHRDVKPANVLLCERGKQSDVVKVLDFGLVKVVGDGAAANLSRAGTIAGTPHYMAPEAVASPDRIDARADLYAVGAVGYFLVTGQHVFDGTTLVEICAHHLHTTPEPPTKRLGRPVPSDLEAVILACLAKSPSDRPADAEDLERRLVACADARGWPDDLRRRWWASHGEQVRARSRTRRPASGTIGRTATSEAPVKARAREA